MAITDRPIKSGALTPVVVAGSISTTGDLSGDLGLVETFNTQSTGQLSGQITITTAGTAVAGPSVAGANGFYVRAADDNLASIYVGNDGAGDVTSLNGYELAPGESIVLHVSNMSLVRFDSVADGDKASWIKA